MSGQPTRAGPSPAPTNAARRLPLPATWRRFGAFLRRPVLPDRADLSPGPAARAVLVLFALDLALMAAVLGGIGLASALGLELPDHLLNGFTLTPIMVAFIVAGAPIGEEIVFRGWLSGRPGHILAVLALLAGAAAIVLYPGSLLAGGALAAAFVLAGALLFALRKRPALGAFQRHFPWFFYASALLFAGVHLSNFAGASPALLPLVLPQFVLALLLGYLRVRHGLLAGIALHMLHNALFAGLMLAGSG
ncbi:CPBP family intramembrane metalloprotease [Altererythrobacter aerius]|uniref:CPBP family intramembrane metalloprotease n=1 Tax=Tsuneonella aeria TaxID=1837929 RepID=A0A6I4TGE0_9SPHN|nr:CPBP family glutamic-type intramembrane protease [Tsuneonella aeria]MXO75706.1 CPBP family intramembrane metalloprotease [Tsuneonella aeria]